ncbi:MAG: hypothetical protein AMXMBFR23_16700 [Chloroflexota bacterium]
MGDGEPGLQQRVGLIDAELTPAEHETHDAADLFVTLTERFLGHGRPSVRIDAYDGGEEEGCRQCSPMVRGMSR